VRRRLGILVQVVAETVVLGMVLGAVCAACGSPVPNDPFHRLVAASRPGSWRSHGDDRFEVWICHVPADTTAAIYGGLPLRRQLTPARVAQLVAATVTPYFESISHGVYRPTFVAGGEVAMAAADTPQACIDRAVAGAAPSTRAVLAVADAEHAPGQPGGFGVQGLPGAADGPVRATHRAAYVGASDFNPSWGDRPPMDLVEHEVGHTLGWVHSGTVPGAPEQYLSALDVMSNSAAPRRTDPTSRDAPDTLALDRMISGWLPSSAVVVARRTATVRLAASTGTTGPRLLVLPVSRSSFLTAEFLPSSGHDAHLPSAGVAVHRVEVEAAAVTSMTPLVGSAPFSRLLRPGESLDRDGWRITISADGAVTAVAS
jgi:hypothetical protein